MAVDGYLKLTEALGPASSRFGGMISTFEIKAVKKDIECGGELAPPPRVVVGAPAEPLQVSTSDLISASRRLVGHASGTAKDSEDTLRFAALTGVRPMVETMPLEDANRGYERMMTGQARFRVVLTT